MLPFEQQIKKEQLIEQQFYHQRIKPPLK